MYLNKALFELPTAEICQYGLANLTYGSLTQKGINTLCASLEPLVNTNIYGLDLGCGDGELIYHLGKILQDSSWEGVEISNHRVNQRSRDVTIWSGDMLQENFRPYNVLHADNLCLDENIADILEEKIVREFTGIYITYRTPKNLKFLKQSCKVKTVPTQTTWTTHPIHFYQVFSN
jgi:hypothetical protein